MTNFLFRNYRRFHLCTLSKPFLLKTAIYIFHVCLFLEMIQVLSFYQQFRFRGHDVLFIMSRFSTFGMEFYISIYFTNQVPSILCCAYIEAYILKMIFLMKFYFRMNYCQLFIMVNDETE